MGAGINNALAKRLQFKSHSHLSKSAHGGDVVEK